MIDAEKVGFFGDDSVEGEDKVGEDVGLVGNGIVALPQTVKECWVMAEAEES